MKARVVGADPTPIATWLRNLRELGMPVPWASSVRVSQDQRSGTSYVATSLAGTLTLAADFYAHRDLATRLGVGPSGTPLKAASASKGASTANGTAP